VTTRTTSGRSASALRNCSSIVFANSA